MFKKIIFLGSKPIGYECFAYLLSQRQALNIEVTGLLTQPRKGFGSGHDLAKLADSNNIPVLSKQNAATFHAKAKERIYEQGGAFEYVEVIKFFSALDKEINGDSQSKKEPDKEFIEYLREEISKQGNGGDKAEVKTERGVKFALAEVGTAYDFSQCNDLVLDELEAKAREAADAVKVRKEFLS